MKLDLSKILEDREKQNRGKPMYRVSASVSRSPKPRNIHKIKEKPGNVNLAQPEIISSPSKSLTKYPKYQSVVKT